MTNRDPPYNEANQGQIDGYESLSQCGEVLTHGTPRFPNIESRFQ